LARIERNVDIKSSPNKIYEILNDPTHETVWNITVKKNVMINADKFELKTTWRYGGKCNRKSPR